MNGTRPSYTLWRNCFFLGFGVRFADCTQFGDSPFPMKRTSFASVILCALSICQGANAAVIAQQDFETSPAGPVLNYTTTGTWSLQSGAVSGSFSPTDSTWGASGRGIGTNNNTTSTILFDSIDTSTYEEVSLAFRLAALSGTGSNANGMEPGDTFTVEVSPNGGTTWYSQIVVNGHSNSNSRWSFAGASGAAAVTYTTGSATTFTPAGGGVRTSDGYTFISVSSLPSTSNLRIRLTALDDNTNERWLVDSLIVSGTPIPEPAAALLGGIGLLGLLRRRR